MKKVLLVEDSITIRMHLTAVLCEAGFDVVHATDGDIAMQVWAAQEELGAVLLDLNLPELNGMAVLERMRGTGSKPFVPVFMLTAGADHEQLARASQLGATGWLLKPVDPQVLVATLLLSMQL